MLSRQRIPDRDDLFSNWWMTNSPQIGLFLNFLDHNKCSVVLGGQNWVIETKYIRHNVMENSYVS